MNISNVNSLNDLSAVKNVSQTVKAATAEKEISEKVSREDTFVKSTGEEEKDKTGIYSRESLLEQLRNSEEQRIKAFQDTIRSMMAKQGETVNITFRGMDLHVTEEQRQEAEKSISDGGEYSVSSVSDRILNMAKALAGDDTSKFSLLKDAVIKGFNSAADMFGKKFEDMPEITQNTYKETMKKFDEWEASFNTDAADNSEFKTDEKTETEKSA